MTEVRITKKGYKELEDKLTYYKAVVRAEVSEELKTARGFGDLSENAEYDAAKKRQAELERDIAELEVTLNYAKIFTPKYVTFCEIKDGVEQPIRNYKIVGSKEADLKNGSIGIDSPIGSALEKANIGEIVNVVLPNGNTKQFKVLTIQDLED